MMHTQLQYYYKRSVIAMTEIRELQPTSMEEFLAMPKQEGWNYELIDGMVMMSPRPAAMHQFISGNLYSELRHKLKSSKCLPIPEIDLVLKDNNLIPDLMVICNEDIRDMKRYEKPPLIAIEIISPSSSSRDHITKRHKYEQLGIQEYWIVSPEEKCITVFDFVNKKEAMYCEGTVKSFVLPEVEINLEDIFV